MNLKKLCFKKWITLNILVLFSISYFTPAMAQQNVRDFPRAYQTIKKERQNDGSKGKLSAVDVVEALLGGIIDSKTMKARKPQDLKNTENLNDLKLFVSQTILDHSSFLKLADWPITSKISIVSVIKDGLYEINAKYLPHERQHVYEVNLQLKRCLLTSSPNLRDKHSPCDNKAAVAYASFYVTWSQTQFSENKLPWEITRIQLFSIQSDGQSTKYINELSIF